jgi:CSLREA domain-containing protein
MRTLALLLYLLGCLRVGAFALRSAPLREENRIRTISHCLLALLVSASLGVLLATPSYAATFTVNSTADPGTGVCDATECTLREAIIAANQNFGADIIAFNISGNGPHTISPTSVLPTIIQAVTIDGYTQGDSTTGTTADDATENTISLPQDGTNAVLKIEIDGTNAGTGSNINGLTIGSSGVVVRGLVINRFEDAGIALVSQPSGARRNNARIQGNFIGTNPAGDTDLGNGGVGIKVSNSTRSYIGSRYDFNQSPTRNLISGNGGVGILLRSDGNQVSGNLIGTAADGSAAVPNAGDGVVVDGYFNIIAQPPTDLSISNFGNVIAHNGGRGVAVTGGAGNQISDNSIFSNGGLGIDLEGGTETNGVTQNDPKDRDLGANKLQNYPTLLTATTDGTNTTITSRLKSIPEKHFTIQFFSNTEADPSGFGEGEEFQGWKTVKTNRRGSASFTFTVNQDLKGEFVTATASHFGVVRDGREGVSTSEFSNAKEAT